VIAGDLAVEDLLVAFNDAVQDYKVEVRRIIRGLERSGVKDQHEQVMQLFRIFGRQTTQRAAHEFLCTLPQYETEIERLFKGMGVAGSKDLQSPNRVSAI
jgi:hypothetical protein